MATLKDTSALNALNEQDYINKLYDTNNDNQKKVLDQNYKDNSGLLDTEQNQMQTQTQENVGRTRVEAESGQNTYNGDRMTAGANAQAALAQDNARQRNITALNKQQQNADAEFERQRKLLASQFETAIRQAQADNDMQRAQALYAAAKAEEAKLLELRRSAGNLMAGKGDTSIQNALLRGETPKADYSGETWEKVLENEGALNGIFDKQLESQLLEMQAQNEEAMSDLQAERQKKQAQTDAELTNAYAESLKKARNYAESQGTRGMGSGSFSQAQLAGDLELQEQLTDIRRQQMSADAASGMKGFDLSQEYGGKKADATADVNKKRAEELLKAAEAEESELLDTQLMIGKQRAKEGDYSILGKLYGLTPDQIDRLMNRGKYAPAYYDAGGNPGGSGYYQGWSNTDLMNMANAGVAYHQAFGTPVSSTGKSASNKPVKTKYGTK